MTTYKLLLLPGDGIGPEVMGEAERIVAWVNAAASPRSRPRPTWSAAAPTTPMARRSPRPPWQSALAADAVMLGAVGGPKWDGVPYDQRPEAGLLRLRKDLELFANLRPAICYPALADASSLKRDLVDGLDIMIVRELTGGVYFGEPKEIVDLGNGQKRAVDTQVYDTYEIERIAAVAFDLARERKRLVHSADKRNVMKTGVLWNEVVTKLHKERYGDVTLHHILADNCAMQLVREPKQFDVIVTDNLFGDMLSDEAAMLTGSLGMLPSASLGARRRARAPARALRAGAWLGARHRRQGRRQPDRHHRQPRHVPALFLLSRRRRRTGSRRRSRTCSIRACAPPTSSRTAAAPSARARWARPSSRRSTAPGEDIRQRHSFSPPPLRGRDREGGLTKNE